jgi:hypothetical protein
MEPGVNLMEPGVDLMEPGVFRPRGHRDDEAP